MVESNLDRAESDLNGVVESNLENSRFGRSGVRFGKYATAESIWTESRTCGVGFGQTHGSRCQEFATGESVSGVRFGQNRAVGRYHMESRSHGVKLWRTLVRDGLTESYLENTPRRSRIWTE